MLKTLVRIHNISHDVRIYLLFVMVIFASPIKSILLSFSSYLVGAGRDVSKHNPSSMHGASESLNVYNSSSTMYVKQVWPFLPSFILPVALTFPPSTPRLHKSISRTIALPPQKRIEIGCRIKSSWSFECFSAPHRNWQTTRGKRTARTIARATPRRRRASPPSPTRRTSQRR